MFAHKKYSIMLVSIKPIYFRFEMNIKDFANRLSNVCKNNCTIAV